MSLSDGQFEWDTPSSARPEEKLIPRFYKRAVKNNFQSNLQGRPVFDEYDFIEITTPGQRATVDRMVKEDDKERFHRSWQAYLRGQEAPLDGIPLDEWPPIGKALLEELKSAGVKTVQQLAALDDLILSKVQPMGGFALRKKAQDYLESIKSNEPLMRLEAMNEELNAQNADLQRQINELKTLIEKIPVKETEQ